MSEIARKKTRNVFQIGFYAIVCGFIPASVVALAFLLERNVILLLLLVPGIATAIYRFPHAGLAIIALSIMLVEALYFNLQIIPRQTTWLSDIVILLLAARVFVFGKAHALKRQDSFRIPLLLFAAVFLCSAFLNLVKPFVVLVSIRQYFKYIILYLVITHLPMTVKSIAWSLRFFFCLVLIQVPIILICFLLGVRGDYLSGGLGAGGTAPLALLCIASANVFITEYIFQGRFRSLLKLALVATVPAISEIKFGILLFPISMIVTALMPLLEGQRRVLVIIIICGFVAAGTVIVYKAVYPDTFAQFGSRSYWSDYLNQEFEREDLPGHRYLGRMARMRIAVAHATDSLAAFSFGIGPGETSDSYFEAGKGSLYSTILGDASGIQFSTVLLELGILGLLLSNWIMIRLSRGLMKLYKVIPIGEDKALICGLFGTSLTYIACIFYLPVIFVTDTTGYLFWVSAAYLSLSMRKTKVHPQIPYTDDSNLQRN